MACTLIVYKNEVQRFKTQMEPQAPGKWFLQSFERLDVISMVDKSIDHVIIKKKQ